MGGIWDARGQSLQSLKSELEAEGGFLDETWQLLQDCVEKIDADSNQSQFLRVCGVTAAKACNLFSGCYSLMLDALAQEAGALLRPLLEALELLRYFRSDPRRVQQVIDDSLPKAGIIARKNQSAFKGLRDHLNDNASHFGMTPHSIRHILDLGKGRIKASQPFSSSVLRTNLHVLFALGLQVAFEAISCLQEEGVSAAELLAVRWESLKQRGYAELGLDSHLSES